MPFEPSFRLLPKIQRQIKAIESTAGFLEAVQLRPEWIQLIRAKTQVRDALSSVQIEGNSLTLEEAFSLAERLPDRELRDSEREFRNYLRAFDAIDGLRGAREAVVSAGDLLNLHRLLLDGVRGGQRFRGEFRREEVKIGDIIGGETLIHHTPPVWAEVEHEVRALMEWIETTKAHGEGDEDTWIHPVIQAGIVQHRLVWIHPFLDGNGRTARMFTALLLFQRGYDFKYLFDLSSYYNRDRDHYYAALRTADIADDYTNWLLYFLGGFAYQMIEIKHSAREGEGHMTISTPMIRTIKEWHVDFVLLMLIHGSAAFRRFLLERFDIDAEPDAGFLGASHSVTDWENRESDLELLFRRSDGARVGVLLEDKIDARFSGDQDDRYQRRAALGVREGLWEEAISCLVAPAGYLADSAESDWDFRLALEDVAGWLGQQADDPYAAVFARVLDSALEKKAGKSKVKELSDEISAFFADYAEHCDLHCPEVRMHPVKLAKTYNAYNWIWFGSSRQRKRPCLGSLTLRSASRPDPSNISHLPVWNRKWSRRSPGCSDRHDHNTGGPLLCGV